mmetsp:Transcript_17965/g.44537  ORF Transcript_17965/g.44537 Transcript_17965/m.44537 type:complete len:86 (+) Transcript_17965:1104-1361(+)
MNVTGGSFMDWAFGHLNYQIEHHLFPQMPRIHYGPISGEVREMMESEGIKYDTRPLVPAFSKLLGHLASSGKMVAQAKAYRKKSE